MKSIKTSDDIKKLGRILGIWAHPDDETFAMGGIMAAAVKNGQFVACVTATRGEKGVQDEKRWPAERLGQTRTNELIAAMKILGVAELCWLDYPDGECKSIENERAVSELAECINRYQPNSILTFGSDGLTGHSDHKCMCDWTKMAVTKSGSKATVYNLIQTKEQYQEMRKIDEKFTIYFNIDMPNVCEAGECSICFKLTGECFDLKLKALKAMPSQYEKMFKLFDTSLDGSLGIEAFVEAK